MSKRFVPYLILSLFFIATIFIFGQNRDINLNVSAETTVVSQCSTRTSVNDLKRDNCEWSKGKWYTDTCICVCPTGFYDYYGTGSCAKLSTTSTVSNTTSTISSTTTIPTTTTTTTGTTTTGTSSTSTSDTTIVSGVTTTCTNSTVKYNCLNGNPIGTWNITTCSCDCPTGSKDVYSTGSCVYYTSSTTDQTTVTTGTSSTTTGSTTGTITTNPITTTTTTTGTNTTDGTTQNTETTINPVVTNTTTTGTVTSDTTGTNTTNQTTVVTTSVCDMTTTLNKQKYANCTDKDNAFIGTWNTVTCSCKCPTGTKDVYSTGSCVYYGTTTTNQCTYTPAEWSACIDGQQKITECIEGKYQTRTRSCGEIQKCERDEWSCDSSWGICVNGIQKRECKKTFDCYIADNPPATERSCIDTKISGTRIITETSKVEKQKEEIKSTTAEIKTTTEETIKSATSTIEAVRSLENKSAEVVKSQLPDECIKAGWNSASKCELYIQQSKIVSECLSKNINTKDSCKKYLIDTYGKPLKCEGLKEDQCNKLIDDVILSDLKEYITEEVKEVIADAVGQTITINTERKTITLDVVKEETKKSEKVEVKVENIPLATNTTKPEPVITATLVPMVEVKSNQQQISSPAAITFDDDGDGLPNDVERRLGTDPNNKDTDGDGIDDKTEVNNGTNPLSSDKKKTEVILSGIDRALVENKSLEQPKFNNLEASKTTLLSVATVETSKPVENDITPKPNLRLQGKAQPNTVVTLYIYSAMPIIVTVTTDENGNWVYDLDKTLVDGKHEVYVAINDDEGKIVAQSVPTLFFVEEAQAVSMEEYMNLEDSSSVRDKAKDMMISYIFGGLGLVLILIVGILIVRGKTF